MNIEIKSKNLKYIIKIQSVIRLFLYRKNNLPNSILLIKHILKNTKFNCSNLLDDGRTNSCIDEETIYNILFKIIGERIKKAPPRHWFDYKIYDYKYGFLIINFKSTTTITSDNTGNMAMCVYALTDEELCLTSYHNSGTMSELLITKIKNNQLNKKYKKDYYFLVVNKNNTNQIICNSFKGLTKLTPNINNLPFQIKWIDNINFVYKKIDDIKNNFIQIIQKPKPSWREQFLNEIRNI